MGYDIRDRDSIGEISVNHPNHICVVADMSSSTWNTVGSHEVFTVTGAVHIKAWAFVTESFAGASGGWAFGTDFASNAISNIPLGAGNLTSGAWISWLDTSIGSSDAFGGGDFIQTSYLSGSWPLNGLLDIFVYNADLGHEISTAAFTDGTIEYHCIWQPLSAGATVTAGSGGSL